MALDKFEKDMAIISALDDEPNDVGGLTAAELKAKFDEAGQSIKQFLNEIFIPQVDEQKAGRDELHGLVLGQIPDGTITMEKLSVSLIASLLSPHVQSQYNASQYEEEQIAMHNRDPEAHGNLEVDGNAVASTDASNTLEDHKVNPDAHQNLIIDGNES